MRAGRIATVLLVAGGLMASGTSLAASVCERWKGRSFIGHASLGDAKKCVSGCAIAIEDVQGATARYTVTGATCAKPAPQSMPVGPAPLLQPSKVIAGDPDVGPPTVISYDPKDGPKDAYRP